MDFKSQTIQNAPHKAASGRTNDDHAPAAPPPPLQVKSTTNIEKERRFDRALLQLEEMVKRMNDPTQVDLPERVMALEDEVSILREQVKFLEDLVMSQLPRLFGEQYYLLMFCHSRTDVYGLLF
jgi:hypothetical protein